MPGYNVQSGAAAFSDTLESLMEKREQAKRQATLDSLALQRENRLEQADLEHQQDVKQTRLDHAQEVADKAHDRKASDAEKRVQMMVPGDIADKELMDNLKSLNMDEQFFPKPKESMPGIAAVPLGVTGSPETPPAQAGIQQSSAVAVRPYIGNRIDREAIAKQQKVTALGKSLEGVTDRQQAMAIALQSGLPVSEADAAVNTVMGPKVATPAKVKVSYLEPKTGKNMEKWVSQAEAEAMGPVESPRPASVTINTGKEAKNAEQANKAADKIMSGEMLLDPEGLTRQGTYKDIQMALIDKGANLEKLRETAIATKQAVRNLNGQQQQRIRQDIAVIDKSLDKVDSLGDEWNAPLWGPFSRIKLAQAKEGVFGADAKRVANQLDAQVSEVRARLASVYQNGGAPTQESQRRADTQLAEWLDAPTLHEMTKLARYNTNLQKTAMDETPPVTTGEAAPVKSKYKVTVE